MPDDYKMCRCCGVKAYESGYGCRVCDCDVEEHAQAEKEDRRSSYSHPWGEPADD